MLNLANGRPCDFARYVKEKKKNLYFWGSGVMLQICLGHIIDQQNLYQHIICCADSDETKAGKHALLKEHKIPIVTMEQMIQQIESDKNAVIVISCSYFYEILEKLDRVKELNQRVCFIGPLMYLENLVSVQEQLQIESPPKIPAKIHYCWFGNKQMPANSLACIESWKQYCPGYEIIRWDESNIDFQKSPWLSHTYKNKQWAFVSDYVRAQVLYQYGGFYFDTDVELIKPLEHFRGFDAFGCFERWPVLNTGGGCGSASGFWLWKEIMALKDNAIKTDSQIVLPSASGYYDTLPLLKRGLKADGSMQTVDKFTILPAEYFHPVDYVSRRMIITQYTHGIHYFNWSWASGQMKKGNSQSIDAYQNIVERCAEINQLY